MQDKKENSRALAYLSGHLTPIDFIKEYQEKKLPVSILFYKVCPSFPKFKLGAIKGAYKHIQEEKLGFLKEYYPEELSEVLKAKRDFRPKIGQYAEFLMTSMLLTCVKNHQQLEFSTIEEDIQSGWDFKYQNKKFDITTNLSKVGKSEVEVIKINLVNFMDEGNLVLEHGLVYLAKLLESKGIDLDGEKVNYANLLVNKIREKYIELSHHQVKTRTAKELAFITEHKTDTKDLIDLIPKLGEETLQVETLSYKLKSLPPELLDLIDSLEKLTPEKRQIIKTLINKLKN